MTVAHRLDTIVDADKILVNIICPINRILTVLPPTVGVGMLLSLVVAPYILLALYS